MKNCIHNTNQRSTGYNMRGTLLQGGRGRERERERGSKVIKILVVFLEKK